MVMRMPAGDPHQRVSHRKLCIFHKDSEGYCLRFLLSTSVNADLFVVVEEKGSNGM
jgi:hypothetical protein